MSLKERLEQDMKEAMKAREAGKTRLSVIRMARAAIKNEEIERGHPLSDDEVLQVLAREKRQRQEALEEYRRAGRQDLVEQMEEEIQVLASYLPEPLTEAELTLLAEEVIAQVGARGPQDMGKVMGQLMPRIRGRAEGSDASRIVRELLGRMN
ncbi:GatB/YqeY domain-containing protein [Thermaerobacter sp. PB12/4term]|uniref:GatB/YqeY domain-containing protein n=1 Tax=Thermaerobacter sp. PB12/4term TaxID=2293838 RepID=UPI000E326C85|nr:GatB/YqeY domain-containing protein [Thermaerobacter sp. PB12/4term]QIA27942.1 GatB/YqeY domain-containing protein [Thermaerobacter sp. PB12/4term]